jgi:hypothetical protein
MNRSGSKFGESTAGIKSVRITTSIRQISENVETMKKISFLFLFLIGAVVVQAQSTEEANVTETINNLFKAMYTNDTTLFKSVFADQVTMATVAKNRDGKVVVQRESGINGFVKAIAKPNPKGALTEEIWNIKVQLDGDFAQVWCDYAFYVGNNFSHCGVDAFHLSKTVDGWKIFHLADTRKREGCVIPQNIQDKHK